MGEVIGVRCVVFFLYKSSLRETSRILSVPSVVSIVM